MMSAVRSKDNKAEVRLRKALWRRGYRYLIQSLSVLGRPDIVFSSRRVAIFVDGDYWHGRALIEGGPKMLREIIRGDKYQWWESKLEKNIARDRDVTNELTLQGWNVIRIWESDIVRDFDAVLANVISELERNRTSAVTVDTPGRAQRMPRERNSRSRY
jgi:DNA mismatch endonuclease (patch repair protein)